MECGFGAGLRYISETSVSVKPENFLPKASSIIDHLVKREAHHSLLLYYINPLSCSSNKFSISFISYHVPRVSWAVRYLLLRVGIRSLKSAWLVLQFGKLKTCAFSSLPPFYSLSPLHALHQYTLSRGVVKNRYARVMVHF